MARSIFLTSAVLLLGGLAAFHVATNDATFISPASQALAAKPRQDWAKVASTVGTGAMLALVEQHQAIAAGKSDYDDRQSEAASVMIGVIVAAVVIAGGITYIGIQMTK